VRSVASLHPSADVVPLGRFTHQDIDVIRLLLRGSSVIDWYRLHFTTREEVEAFIRVNGFDLQEPADRARLVDMRRDAVRYLRGHLAYRVPDEVAQADIVELFKLASGTGRRAHRLHACLVLKVMHILHYIGAHELLSRLPISSAEVAIMVQARIERAVRGLLERSFPVVEFTGNTKSHDSFVTKLLAKKDTQAAQVFDKLRFRLVVERLEDVPPVLLALVRELVPFNYVVPSQSDNTLVDLDHVLVRAGNLAAIRVAQETRGGLNEPDCPDFLLSKNEFSGPDYRIVHFVAEVPVRIDRVLPVQTPRLSGLGPVVFGTTEFQVVDRATALRNETGENRHDAYKARQRGKVKERLERGKRPKSELSRPPSPA
jgi:uncharacterized protein (TIGR04552 family)